MREFVVYTGLRLVLFAAAFVLVAGVWGLAADGVPVLWAAVIAFVVSGVASFFVLDRHREAFARRVQARAERATARFEEMTAREDDDGSA
ncbi:DUF4229 domain-containing protein [Nocardioides donggukensis]|uniref:DUF4229 domain-containing protein n=1 Tax=Nocardioides donggukensis TaxID=2774019 RepID=A0A927K5T1_9ACTN|nr:DUF4229 domain-containing protein [Nocardioides donggukensis]MBD8870817.1 DUF4229 domain-containing protein [Nocardioides donggukensis]